MIQVKSIKTHCWEDAIRGMRNPLESWDKSDSGYANCAGKTNYQIYIVGEKDTELMLKLCKGGSDHRKFMRQIIVTMDITAPLYFWKEFDTYKVGTTANSTSTMHNIHKQPFTVEQFSHDKMSLFALLLLNGTIDGLNTMRESYLKTKGKQHWYDMIQTLPTSYNQTRTVTLNYEVLRNMYHARKHHKLEEWVTFCDIIGSELPQNELITISR